MNKQKLLKQTIKQIELSFPKVNVNVRDNIIFLDGELSNYDEIVAVGYLAAKAKTEGVVNRIKLSGYQEEPMRISPENDMKYDGTSCDVLIIGAGICGAAIAREMSKYKLKTIVIEKENDVGLHASSRNDGVIHVGIDLKVNTEKHRYLRQAVAMYPKLASELHIPYIQRGQLVVFSKAWLRPLMFIFRKMAKKRNIHGFEIWNHQRLMKEEPQLGPDAKFGIIFKEGANICPYETVIALSENAIENGVTFYLDTALLDMVVTNGVIKKVSTNHGTIYPKIVINAAGTFSDKVAALAHDQFYTIHPRLGIEAILDKKAKSRSSSRSVSMYRGSHDRKKDHTKGGGIIPTVDGNVLIGPTAVETPERENFETDAESIDVLFAKHHPTLPKLGKPDVITYFAGIRAATYEEDFIVRIGKWTQNIIHVAGIQSPGLTAAPAIAVTVANLVARLHGAPLPLNETFDPIRKVRPPLHSLSLNERHRHILENPDDGQIVCRCEEISRGEIIAALHRPLVVPTIDGIKRRVRAGMGRCQGGFCGPLITKIIHEELDIPYLNIYKKGHGHIILRETKEATYGEL